MKYLILKPENHKIIKPEKPCRHNREHWRLCKLCLESISPEKVYDKVSEHISVIESNL